MGYIIVCFGAVEWIHVISPIFIRIPYSWEKIGFLIKKDKVKSDVNWNFEKKIGNPIEKSKKKLGNCWPPIFESSKIPRKNKKMPQIQTNKSKIQKKNWFLKNYLFLFFKKNIW
jgi:hypothetical protein